MRLGVNIDHVASVRQARRAAEPDPVHAAVLAELGGADGVTVHLRGDRRHIQDRDVELLRQVVKTRLNLEMAGTQEMGRIALTVKPDQVTLVPERREEVTTEGGLDVVLNSVQLKPMVRMLREGGIRVSLFVDPDLEQVNEDGDPANDEPSLGATEARAAARITNAGTVRNTVLDIIHSCNDMIFRRSLYTASERGKRRETT
jgi:pyridoxine 5-phosphate synthase